MFYILVGAIAGAAAVASILAGEVAGPDFAEKA